jgi:hypothetical protein
MKGRAVEEEGAKQPTERLTERIVSHFMKIPAAVELLRAQHGESQARKVALTEQRKARRARSKRRFTFWAEVAAQIKNGNCNNAADTGPAGGEGSPSRL